MRFPSIRLATSLLFSCGALAMAAVPGCAAEAEGEDVAQGEGELVSPAALARVPVVERGRFRGEGRTTGTQDGTGLASYRFNAFGSAKVTIAVRAKDAAFAPTVVVAGPIPGKENVPVVQRRGTKQGGVELDVTLPEPGAYRILVGTTSALGGRRGEPGTFDVAFTCKAGCTLPEVTLRDVLAALVADVGKSSVEAGLRELLAAHVTDADLRARLSSQLLGAANGAVDPNAAVPVVPMSVVGVAQGLFEHAPSGDAPRRVDERLDVELADLGKDCKVTRAVTKEISSALPGLAIAEVPDYSIDDCALARLEGLAAALNALSLDNGSVVRDGAERYTTVADLSRALVRQGHTLVVDNARYYADFLGLSYKGATVRAPVWVDTGIPLPNGGTLRTPAPHAHHNVYVSGPRFDGQLKFFMGVDGGTSFRVQSNVPRQWSGGRVEYAVSSADAIDDVILLLSTAGELRKKWHSAGASLPMQGYGRLGVCTDSTAVLEHRLRGTVTLFPLAHPPSDARGDAIDAALAALPSDLDGFERADALRRIDKTIPFANVDDVPFPAFVSAWKSLR